MERAISPSLLNLIFELNSELLFCMSAFVFLYYLHFFLFIYLFCPHCWILYTKLYSKLLSLHSIFFFTTFYRLFLYFLFSTGETLCESLSRDMRSKRRLWNENCCCSTKWWCSTYCRMFLFSLLIECWTKNDEMFGTVLCPLIKKRKWKSDIVLSDKVFLFFSLILNWTSDFNGKKLIFIFSSCFFLKL